MKVSFGGYAHDLTLVRYADAGHSPGWQCVGEETRRTGFDFYLAQDYDYQYDVDGKTAYGRVKAKAATDFASVPWWARWFIPKIGRHAEAAVMHDALYCQGVVYEDPGRTQERRVSKVEADLLFRSAMEVAEVGGFQRWVAYAAVAGFGHSRFKIDGRAPKLTGQEFVHALGLVLVVSVLIPVVGILGGALVAAASPLLVLWLVLRWMAGLFRGGAKG